MRINVTQNVKDYEGKPLMRNKTDEKGVPVRAKDGSIEQEPEILRTYLALALNNVAEDREREIFTPEQKNKIYQISTKLYSGNEVDFTLDDLHFMKDRVGKIYGPLIYGRVGDILEGKAPIEPSTGKREKANSSAN